MTNCLLDILVQNKFFVLNGFPRSINSFGYLHKFIQDHGLSDDVCFIQLFANDEVCNNRILECQVCLQWFKVYNASLVKPQEKNKCDNCWIKLIIRQAKNADEFKKRLHFFHAHIEPIIDVAKEFYAVKI